MRWNLFRRMMNRELSSEGQKTQFQSNTLHAQMFTDYWWVFPNEIFCNTIRSDTNHKRADIARIILWRASNSALYSILNLYFLKIVCKFRKCAEMYKKCISSKGSRLKTDWRVRICFFVHISVQLFLVKLIENWFWNEMWL